jgi:hypothetical protein
MREGLCLRCGKRLHKYWPRHLRPGMDVTLCCPLRQGLDAAGGSNEREGGGQLPRAAADVLQRVGVVYGTQGVPHEVAGCSLVGALAARGG